MSMDSPKGRPLIQIVCGLIFILPGGLLALRAQTLDARIDAIIDQMTLQEKIAQLHFSRCTRRWHSQM